MIEECKIELPRNKKCAEGEILLWKDFKKLKKSTLTKNGVAGQFFLDNCSNKTIEQRKI